MKRPKRITILAIFLLLVGIGGLGNAFAAVDAQVKILQSFFLIAVPFIYAIAAFATSIGLLQLKKWAYPAFLMWCTTAVIAAISAQFSFVGAPWPAAFIFIGFLIVVLFLVARYVRNTISATL